MEFHHEPVLLQETIEGLKIEPSGVYVDCTLGGGGHAYEVASLMSSQGIFVGIDQDQDAVEAATERLKGLPPDIRIVKNNFSKLEVVLEEQRITKVNGFLADLGVSSFQLDNPDRGFSYQHDAPLDMRMDASKELTAADIVNNFDEEEISRILWEYSEEKWSKRIASFIVEQRQKKPIETTGELVQIIKDAIPARARRTGPHPAKRVFQALRIAANHELVYLAKVLDTMVEYLAPGGRVCIISFHSLEDRIVKKIFREHARGCTCPPGFPECVCGKVPLLKIITRKPIETSSEEKERNPRARSAKLRIAESPLTDN